MKDETESFKAWVSQRLRLAAAPAPSLRIPVTRENRALLRHLRADELSVWEGQMPSLTTENFRGGECSAATPRSSQSPQI